MPKWSSHFYQQTTLVKNLKLSGNIPKARAIGAARINLRQLAELDFFSAILFKLKFKFMFISQKIARNGHGTVWHCIAWYGMASRLCECESSTIH
jgi:hypothetical protein